MIATYCGICSIESLCQIRPFALTAIEILYAILGNTLVPLLPKSGDCQVAMSVVNADDINCLFGISLET